MYLVRRLDFAEANVSVNTKDDIFDGQFGNRFIYFNYRLGSSLDKGLPIL